jgi:hypothetical protein
MYRYTFVFETKSQEVNQEDLISTVEKKLRKISPYLEQKIIIELPYLYILMQSDNEIEVLKHALRDSLKEIDFMVSKSGFGWWKPISEGSKEIFLSSYSDPNYDGVAPQVEPEGIYSYKGYWILLNYILGPLFATVITFSLFQNIFIRTIILLGYLIYLAVIISRSLTKITCTDNEIIFKPLIGPIKRFQWNEIRSLKITNLPNNSGIVYTPGNRQEFSLIYGLSKKEILIKTIIQNSKLALAETTLNAMIYLRF